METADIPTTQESSRVEIKDIKDMVHFVFIPQGQSVSQSVSQSSLLYENTVEYHTEILFTCYLTILLLFTDSMHLMIPLNINRNITVWINTGTRRVTVNFSACATQLLGKHANIVRFIHVDYSNTREQFAKQTKYFAYLTVFA